MYFRDFSSKFEAEPSILLIYDIDGLKYEKRRTDLNVNYCSLNRAGPIV